MTTPAEYVIGTEDVDLLFAPSNKCPSAKIFGVTKEKPMPRSLAPDIKSPPVSPVPTKLSPSPERSGLKAIIANTVHGFRALIRSAESVKQIPFRGVTILVAIPLCEARCSQLPPLRYFAGSPVTEFAPLVGVHRWVKPSEIGQDLLTSLNPVGCLAKDLSKTIIYAATLFGRHDAELPLAASVTFPRLRNAHLYFPLGNSTSRSTMRCAAVVPVVLT